MSLQMTWVLPESPLALRQEAARIARIAMPERPYDHYQYSINDPTIIKFKTHALIVKKTEVAIGLLIVEARPIAVARVPWDQVSQNFHDNFEAEFHWTVSSIWISSLHRRQSIARKLLLETASHLSVPIDSLAFLAPLTLEAAALLKAIFPESIYITFQS